MKYNCSPLIVVNLSLISCDEIVDDNSPLIAINCTLISLSISLRISSIIINNSSSIFIMVNTENYRELIYKVIGASMEVCNTLGCGLLESVYQEALFIELTDMGIPCVCEKELPIFYKEYLLEKKFRLDMVVADDIIVELKSVAHLGAEHRHQLCNYLRLTRKPIGLLINFGGSTLIGERWVFDEDTGKCFIVDKNMQAIE